MKLKDYLNEGKREMADKAMQKAGMYNQAGNTKTGLGLDGMSKQRVKTFLYKITKKWTHNRLYKDDYWQGPQGVWKEFNDANVNWQIDRSEYYKDPHGISDPMVNVGKRWYFTVFFDNDKGKHIKMNGQLIAAGAGSVEDPLDRYDLVFIVH
jgi:hypothetical protein